MRIRITVWPAGAGATARQVTVTAPDGGPGEPLTGEQVARWLADALGTAGDALCVQGRLLDDTARLGHPPLLDGASVRLVQRSTWTPPRTVAAVAATEVAVVGGPDAGRTRALSAGTHTVGRSGSDLTVGDPSLSRVHLRLDVGPAGTTATDLGSENGTLLDGAPLGPGPTAVGVGAVLRLGHTTLTLRPSRVPPAATTARGDGTLLLRRTPMSPPEPPTVTVVVPPRPDRPPPRRVPWPAVLIPLPVAAVLALFFGPHLLLLAVMSPLMLLGGYLSDRLGSRTTHRTALEEHARTRASCERRRDEALVADRGRRERAHPDLAGLVRAATTPGHLVWSRPEDAPLLVRLGRGTVESQVVWTEDGTADRLPLPDAPVTLDLSACGAFAVTGPLADRVVDGIIGQLLVLHPPRHVVVRTDRRAWSSAPHARVGSAGDLLAETTATLRMRADRQGRLPAARTDPDVVLVVDAASLDGEDLATLIALLGETRGGRTGVHVVVTGLTPQPGAVVLETSSTGQGLLTHADGGSVEVTVDGVTSDWVGRISQALAPLRDGGGPGEELPGEVPLREVLAASGLEPTATGIADRWAERDDGAWTTLGMSPAGPLRLDLAQAGPHALIAGTTGSGKSELLRTLIVSLAAAHPPEDVAVVLVDYKGGSVLAGLASLPHLVGVVTDLDTALTTRALTSLGAEIRQRERLFARCGATDIRDYRAHCRRPGSTLPHLARLVIVVDEFRALADELPEFVTGLVRIAAVGRSLGIHLVLATQRPAGVVTADMRANLALRVALRVRDRSDSQDVVESDAAAALPRSTPGRGLVRIAAEPLVPFQVATVDGGQGPLEVTVEVPWRDGTSTTRRYPLPVSPSATGVVDAVSTTARHGRHRPPPPPWLPPLADRVEWDETRPAGQWAVIDEPAHQRQGPLTLDLETMPHTAIVGAVGSGRTTAVRAMLAAALAAEGERTHVYALADPTGPIATVTATPHTGALLDRGDPAQVAGFVDRLARDVRARQQGEGVDTLLLVVVDGWDVLAEACDALDHGALTDRLLAVLREGHAVGVRAVVTGDRALLTGRVGRTLPERILLRPAETADLTLAGLPHAVAPSHWPPGRAIRVSDRAELHIVLRTLDPGLLPAPTTAPWRLRHLPSRLRLADLSAGGDDGLAVALGAESTSAVTVGGAGRRRILVVGSPGAGRTETLATIAAQATSAGRPVVIVDAAHSDLADRLASAGVCVTRLEWDAHDDLVRLRQAHPQLVVLADDVDRHADSPLVPVLCRVADLAERDGGLIAVAGEGAALAMRPRGVGAAVARARVGIVLGAPTPLDGDLLGMRLPRTRESVPGRGWFVADRRCVALQVAAVGARAEVGASAPGTLAGGYSGADRPFHPTATPVPPRSPRTRPGTT